MTIQISEDALDDLNDGFLFGDPHERVTQARRL
jgi:hypothetical protein